MSWSHNGLKGEWRNGSASDSRSEGWELESLCPHVLLISSSAGSRRFNSRWGRLVFYLFFLLPRLLLLQMTVLLLL